MTRLTIAIPNYNGGENLKRAIISCRNITIPVQEYEIIVVDNCSTDNSRNIVNELKNEFANLIFLQNKENVGRINTLKTQRQKNQQLCTNISMRKTAQQLCSNLSRKNKYEF